MKDNYEHYKDTEIKELSSYISRKWINPPVKNDSLSLDEAYQILDSYSQQIRMEDRIYGLIVSSDTSSSIISSNGSSNSSWEELEERIRYHKDKAKKNGEPMFMGLPDKWLEDPTWRCVNGHVSKTFVKSEKGDLCLACLEICKLTYPEDKENE